MREGIPMEAARAATVVVTELAKQTTQSSVALSVKAKELGAAWQAFYSAALENAAGEEKTS